jgi:hypothetical protein
MFRGGAMDPIGCFSINCFKLSDWIWPIISRLFDRRCDWLLRRSRQLFGSL